MFSYIVLEYFPETNGSGMHLKLKYDLIVAKHNFLNLAVLKGLK